MGSDLVGGRFVRGGGRLFTHSFKGLIRLEMRKWKTNRIEEILVSNSSLVSGLSEASRARFSWVEVSQEKSEQTSRDNKNTKDKKKGQAI